MKLFSITLCLLPLLAHCGTLEDEKNVKVSGSKDKSTLGVTVMIDYNHKNENGENKYPTSFLSQYFKLEDAKLVELFKLDREKITYADLRNHLTQQVTGKNLVDALVTNENFNKPLTGYPEYVAEKNLDDKLIRNSTRHFYNHNKLISAILPFYVIIGVFSLCLFFNRDKLDYNKLQFSRTSKVLFAFLIFRLVYDLIYLSYLIVFQFFGKFHESNFLYYLFLVSDQVLGLIIFHCCITIFVQGYLTLSQTKGLWFHKDSLLMSLFYFLSFTCIKIYLRVKHSDNNEDSLTKYVLNMKDQDLQIGYFMIFLTFSMRLSILIIMLKNFKRTYIQSNGNGKFLNSFIVIFLGYFLSGYIKFPIFFKIDNLSEVLKNELIGEGDIDFVTEAISIPEIIQIIAACRLIYIWRDVGAKGKDVES